MKEPIRWGWRPRTSALAARAAVAHGEAASALTTRLRGLDESQLGQLEACAAPGLLVVAGPASALPWVPAVDYAAPCPEAPALWLPTTVEPDLPADLLARALTQRHGRSPLLLWPRPCGVIPLDGLLPLSTMLLASILQAWRMASA